MKASSIYSERKEGKLFSGASTGQHPRRWFYRNIVTHHAEDGSGVGSAIIAG